MMLQTMDVGRMEILAALDWEHAASFNSMLSQLLSDKSQLMQGQFLDVTCRICYIFCGHALLVRLTS